jgi:hypothetical protein
LSELAWSLRLSLIAFNIFAAVFLALWLLILPFQHSSYLPFLV